MQKRLVPAFISRNGDQCVMLPHGTAIAVPKDSSSTTSSSVGRETADGILKVNGVDTDVRVLSPLEADDTAGQFSLDVKLSNVGASTSPLSSPLVVASGPEAFDVVESLDENGRNKSGRILVNTDIVVDHHERTSRAEVYGSSAGARGRSSLDRSSPHHALTIGALS